MNSRQRRAKKLRRQAEAKATEAGRGVPQSGSALESGRIESPTESVQVISSHVPEMRGAMGGPLSPSDIALVRRGIRNDWPISEATRQQLMQQMASLAESAADERTRVSAAKTLIAADAINARREASDVAAVKDPVSVRVDNRRVTLILPHNGRDSLPTVTETK